MSDRPRRKEELFEDTACYHCGRMSCGIAYRDDKYDPMKYLCNECKEFIMELREVRNLDRLETAALDYAVERVAKYLDEELGGVTDLSKLTELDAKMMMKHAVLGFGDGVRALAAEGKY